MTKKQTAVEFAVDKLEKFIPSGNQIAIFAILKHAKQIEKEQILLARLNGFEESAEGWNGEYPTMTKEETILRIKNEEYYNDEYGK